MPASKDKRLRFLQEECWATLPQNDLALLETIYCADVDADHQWLDDIEFVGKLRSHDQVRKLLREKKVANADDFDIRKMKSELDRRKAPLLEKLTLKTYDLKTHDVSARTIRLHIKLKQPIPASKDDRGLQMLRDFWRNLVPSRSARILYAVNIFRREGPDKQSLRSELPTKRGEKPEECLDWHTGVGELHAVHHMTRVLSDLGCDIEVFPFYNTSPFKPRTTVIWLGSELVIDTIPEHLIGQARFVWDPPTTAYLKWTDKNGKGSNPIYPELKHTHSGYSSGKDSAVVAVAPDPNNSHRIGVLAAGITPFGTAGAAMCLASSELNQLEIIKNELGAENLASAKMHKFAALLTVHVEGSIVTGIKVREAFTIGN
jgi:hypothetical protein